MIISLIQSLGLGRYEFYNNINSIAQLNQDYELAINKKYSSKILLNNNTVTINGRKFNLKYTRETVARVLTKFIFGKSHMYKNKINIDYCTENEIIFYKTFIVLRFNIFSKDSNLIYRDFLHQLDHGLKYKIGLDNRPYVRLNNKRFNIKTVGVVLFKDCFLALENKDSKYLERFDFSFKGLDMIRISIHYFNSLFLDQRFECCVVEYPKELTDIILKKDDSLYTLTDKVNTYSIYHNNNSYVCFDEVNTALVYDNFLTRYILVKNNL